MSTLQNIKLNEKSSLEHESEISTTTKTSSPVGTNNKYSINFLLKFAKLRKPSIQQTEDTQLKVITDALDKYNESSISEKANEENSDKFSIFPQHKPLTAAIEGVINGKYLTGDIKIHKFGRDAYIKNTDVEKPDFIVQGLQNQNRALNNDVVIFEVLDSDLWVKVKNTGPVPVLESLTLESEKRKEVTLSSCPMHPSVKVVSIQKRFYMGNDCPKITATMRWNENHIYPIASPLDCSLPDMVVYNFPHSREQFQNLKNGKIYQIEFLRWKNTCRLPLAGFLGEFEIKDIGKMILTSESFQSHFSDYSEIEKRQINQILEESQSTFELEVQRRKDFRDLCVFTIDPPTAKDLDDAVHIEDKGQYYEVGVHIADVSHYVAHNSPLDLKARDLCITLYTPETSYSMLPAALSKNLCSLLPNSDKLTISVIYHITKEGVVLEDETQIYKGVIRTCSQLNYDIAQQIIDIYETCKDPEELRNQLHSLNVPIDENSNHTLFELCENLVALKNLTFMLSENRNVGIILSSNRFEFNIRSLNYDSQNLEEIHKFHSYNESNAAHTLIEELMIMTNMFIGKMITRKFPLFAIIRVNTSPDVEYLTNRLKDFSFDLKIDFTQSLHKITRNFKDRVVPLYNKLIQNIIIRMIEAASYVLTNKVSSHSHFCLGVEQYTHFTSPIRRYIDLVVHRLVSSYLDISKLPYSADDVNILEKICENCNKKHTASRESSHKISMVLYSMWLNNKSIYDSDVAIVTEISPHRVQVLLPKLNLYQSLTLNSNRISPNVKDKIIFFESYKASENNSATINWDMPECIFGIHTLTPYTQKILDLCILPVYILPSKNVLSPDNGLVIVPIAPFHDDFKTVLSINNCMSQYYEDELKKSLTDYTLKHIPIHSTA